MNQTREQVYEYLRHLDFNSIKNLCKSDRYYANLCNTPMFSRLIKQKFHKMIVEQQIERQLNLKIRDYFTYEIDNDYHDLNIQKTTETTFYLLEHIRSYSDSILFELFKQEAISKLSPGEYNSFITEVQKSGNRSFTLNGTRYNFITYSKFITYSQSVAIRIYDASREQVQKVVLAIFRRSYPTIIHREPYSDVKRLINYPRLN